jgi:1-phosphatidylinositol-4-phosphate 5-kinase
VYGRQNGQGTFIYLNGDKYEGKWKDGEIDEGTLTWKDGVKNAGEYKGGQMWNGTKYDKDGNILYKIVNGKRIKQLSYLYRFGECCDFKWEVFGQKDINPKYQGQVKDGIPNGQGTLTWSNGNKYVGIWKDGEENGQGTFTYHNGRKYVGEYKDEKPRNGIYYDKNRKSK